MRTLPFIVALVTHTVICAQPITEALLKPGTDNLNWPYDMIAANDGGYFITGKCTNDSDKESMFLLKLNADLDSVWTRHYSNDDYIAMRGDALFYNANGNLCVMGITSGPGVWISHWELDQNGDTLSTGHYYTGTSGIDYVVTDAVARPDGGYVVTVRNTSSSSGIYSFDANMELVWRWPSAGINYQNISPNCQFTGIELVDTTLYFSGRKVNGSGHACYFHARGLSGHVISTDTFGSHAQQMRAEDIVIVGNEAFLVGTKQVEYSTGVSGARLMVMRTNLSGDSLGLVTDNFHQSIENVDIIDGNILSMAIHTDLNGTNTPSVAAHTSAGAYAGRHDLSFGGTSAVSNISRVIRTLSDGDGHLITLGMQGSTSSSRVYVVKYTPEALGAQSVRHQSDLSLFPNPATTTVFVFGDVPQLPVVATDAVGRRFVLPASDHERGFQVNVSSLASGVYALSANGLALGQVVVYR